MNWFMNTYIGSSCTQLFIYYMLYNLCIFMIYLYKLQPTIKKYDEHKYTICCSCSMVYHFLFCYLWFYTHQVYYMFIRSLEIKVWIPIHSHYTITRTSVTHKCYLFIHIVAIWRVRRK